MGIKEIEIAGQSLTIHENDDIYDPLTGCPLTGSWLWDSALVLSHWLRASQLDLQGKSVLELGAGAGLPGLTAAKLGASRVVLTDVASLLPGLIKNVESNGVGDRVEVRELVWGSEESGMGVGEFDVVLMSDVFFDPEGMKALGRTLKGVCGKEGGIWAATELRPATAVCLNELVTLGFRVLELPTPLAADELDGRVAVDMFAVYQLIAPDEDELPRG